MVTSGVQVFDPTVETWADAGTCDPSYEDHAKRTVSQRRAGFGFGRVGHTATVLADGRLLLVGGDHGFEAPPPKSAVYDPKLNQWSYTAAMKVPRTYHSALLLPDGRVIVLGGQTGGINSPNAPSIRTVEIYEPLIGK